MRPNQADNGLKDFCKRKSSQGLVSTVIIAKHEFQYKLALGFKLEQC